MHKQVVAVEPQGYDTTGLSAAGQGSQAPSERIAGKFLHPGGSRPLEGYTIKRGVGQGGFGEIYYAVSDAGKEVALKLIRRNLDVELRGIRHCLNLKHPNLLDLYDIRQDSNGDTWVVMEYVAGESLEQALVENPGGLPLDQAMAWLQGIGAGVAYLHDRGIVHRDLKPGNIFSSEGLVKVGDYGLSKFISCSRRSGHTESIGTVHYMAPEVANGRYGKEIDIYALGIVLYEMLTGRVPFDGESVGEVLMKHLTAKPDVSMLAEPYRSVIARALEKDPALRFRSVAEMLAALPGAAQAPSIAGRLPSGSPGMAGASPFADRPFHGPAEETFVRAESADDEPILRAVRENWRKLCNGWNQANLHPAIKIILLIAVAFALLNVAGLLIPLAIVLCVTYGVYRLVRAIVLLGSRPSPRATWQAPPGSAPPRYAPTQPRAPPQYPPAYVAAAPAPRPRPAAVERPAPALVVKTPGERFTDLVGSLLVGSLVAIIMCVVMILLDGLFLHTFQSTYPRPEQCAWLLLIGIAGTWAVLIPAKFWEGTRGEAVLRRFTLMVIGLPLGLLAYGVADAFCVNLVHNPGFPQPKWPLPPGFYEAGQPLAMAYLACFGTLFVLGWWYLANPLRSARLGLAPSIWCMIVAFLVAYAWQFPQPWLPMTAGIMAVSIQLASPWVHPGKRLRRNRV